MYPPELQTLIKSAIADGKITDVEMRVLRNKAAELGIDPDEVQIYCQGLVAQMPNTQAPNTPAGTSTQRQNYFAGHVEKCPSCGAVLDKSGYVECPYCHVELRGKAADNTIVQLQQQIQALQSQHKGFDEAEEAKMRKLGRQVQIPEVATLIRTYPIPMSSQAMLEFLSLCVANVNDPTYGSEWRSKADQVITQVQASMPENPQAQALIQKLKQETAMQKRVLSYMQHTVVGRRILIAVIVVLIILILSLF